jgi:hypothetical protein
MLLRVRRSTVFKRAKKVGDATYYKLVENHRDEGSKTPRQRVLLHLGRYDAIEAALNWPREIRGLRRDAEKIRERYENWPRKDGSDDAVPGHTRARLRTARFVEHRADALASHLVRLKVLVRERRKS